MDTFMCYGAVVPDGYGVCYNPRPNNIIVCIAAFKASPETQADYFANTLEGSLLQMQELCTKTKDAFDLIADRLRNTSVSNGSSCDKVESFGTQMTNNNNNVRPKQTENHVKSNGQRENDH